MSYADLGPPDFETNVWRLRPPGLAWAAGIGSVLRGYWNAIADAIAAVHARAAVLSETESFPPTAVELLPDWEAVLGLPDPCLGANPLIAARQAAAAARLAATGGQSIAYFEALAANLGGQISVTEYAPFIGGINRGGQPVYPQVALFWWLVTITGAPKFFFVGGIDTGGSPLWQVGNDPISCEIQRLAPAHTLVFFAAAAGQGGAFVLDQSQLDGPDILD